MMHMLCHFHLLTLTLATFSVILCKGHKRDNETNNKVPVTSVSYYEIVNIEISTASVKHSPVANDFISVVRFVAYGRIFILELLKIPDAIDEGVVITLDGSPLAQSDVAKLRRESCLYRGIDNSDPMSWVYGRIIDHSVFDGVVKFSDGEIFFLEPLRKYDNCSRVWNSTMIYRESDLARNESRQIDGAGARLLKFSNYNRVSPGTTTQHFTTRRKRGTSATYFSCILHIFVDHTFYQFVGGNSVSTTVSEIKYQVGLADTIFRGTDFDGNGAGDNTGFEISQITIFTNAQASDYKMSDTSLDGYKYLDAFSLYDHGAFCLSVAFSYRDFDDGLVGLAWVGSSNMYGPVGGICQQRVTMSTSQQSFSFNTAMVTMLNYGERLPSYKSALVLTHEFGHSFGSPHDTTSNTACAPGGAYGNYIMYAMASSGGLPNNDQFSKCSIDMIYPVIVHKGSCFVERTGPYCGNRIKEGSEECDCGNLATCQYTDSCCTPSDITSSDPPCTFRRAEGKVCSPRESPCCTPTCSITPLSNNKVCGQRSECLDEVKCDGASPKCPVVNMKPNGTSCDDGNKICHNGVCSRSVCEKYELHQCQCTTESELCSLCCRNGSTCLSLRHYVVGAPSPTLSPGEACDGDTGICDQHGKCILGTHDSPINRLKRAFDEETASEAKEWMRNNWYYVMLGTLVLVGLTIIFIKSRRERHNIQSHAHRMGRFDRVIAQASTEKQRQQRLLNDILKLYDDKIHMVSEGKNCKEFTNAIARLSTLFPTVDREVLTEVARHSTSEGVAVKMLLIKGYPMRCLFDQSVAEESDSESGDTQLGIFNSQ